MMMLHTAIVPVQNQQTRMIALQSRLLGDQLNRQIIIKVSRLQIVRRSIKFLCPSTAHFSKKRF